MYACYATTCDVHRRRPIGPQYVETGQGGFVLSLRRLSGGGRYNRRQPLGFGRSTQCHGCQTPAAGPAGGGPLKGNGRNVISRGASVACAFRGL
jgi:hypothetical protein